MLAPTYRVGVHEPFHVAQVAHIGAISAFFEGEVVPEAVCDRMPTSGRRRSALGTLWSFYVEGGKEREKMAGKFSYLFFHQSGQRYRVSPFAQPPAQPSCSPLERGCLGVSETVRVSVVWNPGVLETKKNRKEHSNLFTKISQRPQSSSQMKNSLRERLEIIFLAPELGGYLALTCFIKSS